MSGIEYASLQPEFSRRILLDSAYKINPALLSQAVDVSSKLDKNAQKPSKGLPGYFVYGWKKAADEIVRASNLGITYISLRFVSSAEGHKDINAGLEDFETTLSLIQREIQSLPVKLIVDPFGLALTQDGQWGILQGDSGFDKDKTFTLLERVGCILSRNNVHGVVTLGRIPEEVRLTKKGIIEGGG